MRPLTLAIIILLILAAVGGVLTRAVGIGGEKQVVVHWTTGHLLRDGLLKDMATEFNKAGNRTKSGKRVVVEVYNVPSELQGK